MQREACFMKRMGELLAFHKIINRPEDLNDDNFDDAIVEFQEKADIMADGIPRWETLWQLQFPWVQQQPKLSFVKCDADKLPGIEGHDHVWLRQDAAEKFNELRKEVLALGGVMPIEQGKRPLSEGVSMGKSSTSLHYTGLAFDLSSNAGFFKPDTDPFVITLGGSGGYWELWCRSSRCQDTKLNALYWDDPNSGKDRHKTIQGNFINFTRTAGKYGFSPIRPRLSFTRAKDRKYIGCEWWHFQANDLLIPNLSQLGIELMRIAEYTPEYIRNTSETLWGRKQAIFQQDWF